MKKITLSSIDKFKVGQTIFGFYLCKEKYNKKTRLGDDYIDLVLKDATSNIRAKIWENAKYFTNQFSANNIVAIKGTIEEFNKENEVNIKSINAVNEDFYLEYGYSNSLIIGSVSEPIKNLRKYINIKIKSLPVKYSRILVKAYRIHDFKVERVPIDKDNFTLEGGLLQYTCTLLRMYDAISHYYDLDSDKVITCILLMNIGYIEYYEDDLLSISEDGKEFNVNILGVNLLVEIFSNYKNIDNENKTFLKNCILMSDTIYDKEIYFVKRLISLGSVNVNNHFKN